MNVYRYPQLTPEQKKLHNKRHNKTRKSYQLERSREIREDNRKVREFRAKHPEEYAKKLKQTLAHAMEIADMCNDERLMRTVMFGEMEGEVLPELINGHPDIVNDECNEELKWPVDTQTGRVIVK